MSALINTEVERAPGHQVSERAALSNLRQKLPKRVDTEI